LFVGWWDASVQDAGGDRQSKKALFQTGNNALSVPQAEKKTSISAVQVSRWRKQYAAI